VNSLRRPITPLQKGMLAHSIGAPGLGMYIVQPIYQFVNLDVQSLEYSLNKVVEHHDILRASFYYDGSDTVMEVHSNVDLEIRSLDWTDEPSAFKRQTKLKRFLAEDRREGFDCSKAPLIRPTVIHTPDSKSLFIFTHHHLLLDGLSSPIVSQEIIRIYQAKKVNAGEPILKPRPSFTIFLDWLSQRSPREDLEYWKEYMNGYRHSQALPCQKDNSFSGLNKTFNKWTRPIDANLIAEVNELSRKTNTTTSSIFLAALCLTCSRYTGSNDFVIGLLFNGRPVEIEDSGLMVGMFMNTLPFRAQIDPGQSVEELILKTHEDQIRMSEHQYVSLNQISDICGVSGSSQLVHVILDNKISLTREAARTLDGKTQSDRAMISKDDSTSMALQSVPLHFNLETVGDQINFTTTFQTSLFSTESIPSFCDRYISVIKQFCRKPDLSLGSISILLERDDLLLRKFHEGPEIHISPSNNVIQLFMQQADKTPDNIAVIFKNLKLTYKELYCRALRLSNRLVRRGIVSGDIIAFQIDRTENLPVLILAILQLGAIYVPIDPSVPKERVSQIISDSSPKLFVSDSANAQLSESIAIDLSVLFENLDSDTHYHLIDTAYSNEQTAYILYTSGSTGKPKGIRIPHQVLVSRILVDPYPPETGEVIVSKTSCSFVDFLWELFLPLVNGNTCILLPTSDCKDPLLLASTLSTSSVRRITLVPSLLTVILELPGEVLKSLAHINKWFSTGEPLGKELAISFYRVFANAKLFNLYGASEVWDISLAEVPSSLDERSRITAGKALPNTSIYILDDQQNLLPPGFRGNIVVSGSHLALGYTSTSSSINLGFNDILIYGSPKRCWYTGDQGYWTPEGQLIVEGRRDTLVKLRGFRIDLNEIESVVKRHHLVRDCAVCVFDSDRLGISILLNDIATDIKPIKGYILERLPEYMIPSTWIPYSEFPLLSSGKIDRRRLQSSFGIQQTEHLLDRTSERLTDTESHLLQIAKSLFSISSISIDSDFFESGGHSLMAVRLLSRLSKHVNKQVSLESIFNYPIFRDLARYVDSIILEAEGPQAHDQYDRLSPASLPQRRLWIVDALATNKDSYILTSVLQLAYHVDPDILSQSISHLINRHSILRTSFTVVDGEPYQLVRDSMKIPLILISPSDNLGGGSSSGAELINSYSISWSLSEGPLFYLFLANDQADGSTLGLKIHHIISDGTSVKIFFDELLSIYSNLSSSRHWQSGMPDLKLQYRDYSIWQYDWSKSDDFHAYLDFWKSKLQHRTNQLEFQRSAAISLNVSNNSAISYTSTLGPRLLSRVRSSARRAKTSLFNVLLSIFALYISRHTGEYDVNIGSPVTGRTTEDLQPLIGFFVNLLVYPLSINENLSLDELVVSTSGLTKDILSHQHIQFDQLVRKLAPDRDESSQPLFQVMLVHEIVSSPDPVSRSTSHRFSYGSEHANYDYLLLVREHSDFLELTHQVRATIFSPPVLKGMASRFNTLVSRATLQPCRPLNQISMLPTSEYKKIVCSWNSTRVDSPFIKKTITTLFLDLVFSDPLRNCVVDPCGTWSRRDILNLASSYQDLLSQYNIGLHRSICLSLHKSAHQVALVLAINSLGHSFVPLDPKAPAARSLAIIQSCDSPLLFYDSPDTQKYFPGIIYAHYVDTNITPNNLVQIQQRDFVDNSSVHDTAYICFTSGSTGVPKGVMVSQLNIVSLYHAHSLHFKLSQNSRVLSTLGFYFDAGIGEQIRALLSGSTIYFSASDLLRNPSELINNLRRHAITHVGIPPSVLQAIDPLVSKELKELKVLVTAGESLSPATAQSWGSNRTIITGHGATETTVGDTISVNWNLMRTPPLGRPLANMQAYVVNRSLQVNPPYVIGELVISGPQVSKGYLNDAEKTSASFLDEIAGIRSPYKLYLTGDLAYYDQRGILYFSGRRDSQLKIRGHRVEVSEVESTALTYRGILQAVCTSFTIGKSTQLVLYYVGDKISPSELTCFLEDHLPGFMVPAAIINVTKIPTTQNGKTDFRSLPAPQSKPSIDRIIAPSTSTEKQLYSIWVDVLHTPEISIDSKFFSIGGDSIQAIQMLTKCKQAGLRLTPVDLYKHQTIQGLALFLDRQLSSS
jgi:amino acid adenylation domain-containing protein